MWFGRCAGEDQTQVLQIAAKLLNEEREEAAGTAELTKGNLGVFWVYLPLRGWTLLLLSLNLFIYLLIMKENIKEIVREMQTSTLTGSELEDKEFLVLQELCGATNPIDLEAIYYALGASGTILAIPVLCAQLITADLETKPLLWVTIKMIRSRAKERGSILPDEFYTPEHFKPRWNGSKNAFLSYVQVIADIYIKQGHNESETDRIGEILAGEMGIDLSPYQTFADFKICQTDWDFEQDYRLVLDRMAQEQILADAEEAGISESDISLITGTLMDLQYDYLIARLKLEGNLEYFRFAMKMAGVLNKPEQ